jgi:hypothetical protein
VEKIQHLERLQGALQTKLNMIERGKKKKAYRKLGKAIEVRRTAEGEYEYCGLVDVKV